MRKLLFHFLGGMLLMSACGESEIRIRDAWARAAAEGGNSAVYLTLRNNTGLDDELTRATSDVAASVELHESRIGSNGVMQMIPRESVPIAAGEEVTFEPGGLHVMLIDLTQGLEPNDEILLKLHFRSGAELTLLVPVKDAAAMGGSGMDGHTP